MPDIYGWGRFGLKNGGGSFGFGTFVKILLLLPLPAEKSFFGGYNIAPNVQRFGDLKHNKLCLAHD